MVYNRIKLNCLQILLYYELVQMEALYWRSLPQTLPIPLLILPLPLPLPLLQPLQTAQQLLTVKKH